LPTNESSIDGYKPEDDETNRKGSSIEVVLGRPASRARWTQVWDVSLLARGILYVLVLAYILFFGWLSILRHETYQSNAMDLGYTDQVVWNTLRGRFMRFSTFQGAPIDLPLEQFRRTDTLLSYHVELLLVPISLLYLVYDSPVTLLVLQTVVIALGALPAFWLARDHLDSAFAGLVFAAVYLLAPAIEGANLSDFHAVSMTASLLLFALYFLHTRRWGGYFVAVILALLAKEDISLLLLMVGLYAFFFLKERVIGVFTALMGLAWFAACTQMILPFHNGLPTSPFYHRITIFGPTIQDSALNLIRDPTLLLRWLSQPEIVAYLGGLLASAGFMSIFSPVVLGLSAPVLAMNTFSSWSWTYSEGAHYSASIIPFVIVSGIYGLGFLAGQASRRSKIPHQWAVGGLSAFVLLVGGYHHYRIGISPLSRSFHPPRITPHDRLARELMALIPPDAALSTQSGLYPHLAHREKAYMFPGVNDAEYVLLDVTGSPYPITITEVYETADRLLRSGDFGVLAAQDGYLLLKRGLWEGSGKRLPGEFYTFARVDEATIPYPLRARFGDSLELVGYDYAISSVVHAQQLPATVTTYWRPLRPLAVGQGIAVFFSRQDGAVVYHYDGATPTTTWYPTYSWEEGEVVRVETPILSVGRLRDAMVAVVAPSGDPWSVEDRLQPVVSLGENPSEVYQEGTLLRLFGFP
jgi:uncharacterized membrane protein